jgi:hypothetical protein
LHKDFVILKSKGWRRGDYQKKYWNGDHQGEGNEADQNLPGRRGLEEMGEKGLVEEDWTDRNNWRRKIA